MSRVLEEFPPIKYKTNGSKYPIDLWLDGRIHELIHKRDYECSVDSVVTTLRKSADNSGYRLRTRRIPGGVVVQKI